MLNTIALIGHLTGDPELRHTNTGRPVCNLRIAVDGRREENPCFVDVVTFDASAEACAEYLTRGRLIAVNGRLVLDEWTTSDGEKRSRHKVIGQIKFLPDSTRSATSEEDSLPDAA